MKNQKYSPLETRFWAKVDTSGDCWIWTASKDRKGYGQMLVNCKPHRAHRLSWILHNGEIPEGGHCLHHCDNPACVNPEHLYIGSHSDNMQDMVRRGRRSHTKQKGSSHTRAILTEEQVRDIKMRLSNETVRGIADSLGLKKHVISDISAGRTWKQI
jgi:hypothetical protein